VRCESRSGQWRYANLFLGGPFSQAFNNAVHAAYNAGILTIVAAGNDNVRASTVSPASAAGALTVGAVTPSWTEADYSNYGPSVDLLGPGSVIVSAGITSNSATHILSGTSMAAPHVAGVALYLMALENIATPAALTTRVKSLATSGDVFGLKPGTPNLLVYNGFA
jgi:oryzin